ncbi:MAG: LLM class flavin-dependent oxidoreductase [Cypionkella sp.]
MKYSILDLSSVAEGQTPREALAHTLDLARHAEAEGYHRFWLAEHHGMAGIASAATAVVIGHVAGGTKTIRVGAGGIMLPNHAPLVIAEQFGTLASLYPDRIDLGLGRAPGTDMATARALRRNMESSDQFPEDVMELIQYLGPVDPAARIRAVPGEGTEVPVWILGSSLYGAQLAAYLGLPYAFASHFAPAALDDALQTYRATFRPSQWLETPYFMLLAGLSAAETEAEAEVLRSSQRLAFSRLRMGKPGKLPAPQADLSEVPAGLMADVDQALSCSVVSGRAELPSKIAALLARYQPDEIMFTGAIYDHAARLRSFSLAAEAMKRL